MDILLLGRVSSHRQEKEETIETQLDYLRRWADLNNHRILGVYVDEAVSGTVPLANRPDGERLLEDLATTKAQAVVVYRIDRLGRSALVIHEALEKFRQAGVEFISATESFDSSTAIGRMVLGFIALFAEFERESMLQRCMDGKRTAAHNGQWCGGRTKYGYDVDESGHFISNIAQAAIIDWIFQTVDEERFGLRRLGGWLEEHHILSPSGGTRWHPNTLRKILQDPAYKGMAVWAGISFPCPPLVSEERWERVQRILHDPERRPHGRRKGYKSYLLSGLIRCGVPGCGRIYQGQRWKNGERLPEGQHGYICNGRVDASMKGHRCQSPWLDGAIEQDILAECQRWLDDPSRLRRLLAEQRTGNTENTEPLIREKHRLQSERADLREERATLVAQLGKKRITDEDFDQRDLEIKQEDQVLQSRINTLELRLTGLRATADQVEEREALLEKMKDKEWSPEAKIELLVRDIEVFPDGEGGARVRVSYWPAKQCELSPTSRRGDQFTLLAPCLTYYLPLAA